MAPEDEVSAVQEDSHGAAEAVAAAGDDDVRGPDELAGLVGEHEVAARRNGELRGRGVGDRGGSVRDPHGRTRRHGFLVPDSHVVVMTRGRVGAAVPVTTCCCWTEEAQLKSAASGHDGPAAGDGGVGGDGVRCEAPCTADDGHGRDK